MSAQNHLGLTGDGGHARDADTILGDNGNVFRIVERHRRSGPSRTTPTLARSGSSSASIQLLDYSPTGDVAVHPDRRRPSQADSTVVAGHEHEHRRRRLHPRRVRRRRRPRPDRQRPALGRRAGRRPLRRVRLRLDLGRRRRRRHPRRRRAPADEPQRRRGAALRARGDDPGRPLALARQPDDDDLFEPRPAQGSGSRAVLHRPQRRALRRPRRRLAPRGCRRRRGVRRRGARLLLRRRSAGDAGLAVRVLRRRQRAPARVPPGPARGVPLVQRERPVAEDRGRAGHRLPAQLRRRYDREPDRRRPGRALRRHRPRLARRRDEPRPPLGRLRRRPAPGRRQSRLDGRDRRPAQERHRRHADDRAALRGHRLRRCGSRHPDRQHRGRPHVRLERRVQQLLRDVHAVRRADGQPAAAAEHGAVPLPGLALRRRRSHAPRRCRPQRRAVRRARPGDPVGRRLGRPAGRPRRPAAGRPAEPARRRLRRQRRRPDARPRARIRRRPPSRRSARAGRSTRTATSSAPRR